MHLKRPVRIFAVGALVAGLTGLSLHGSLRGQSTTQPDNTAAPVAQAPLAAKVSPDARVLLEKVRDAYAKLGTLDLAGTVSIAFDGGGQRRFDHAEFTGAFHSPNQFRHDMKDEATIVSNGDKLYTFIARKNAYTTDAAPKSRADGLPGEVTALLLDQDPSLALAVSPSASDLLTANASEVSLGDSKTLNGIVYPSLKITQDDEDETVLIDPRTNLVHSVQHDLTRSVKRQGVPDVKVALVTVDYTTSAQQAQAVSFDWTPPSGAKPLAASAPEPAAGDNPYAPVAAALDGKPAPAFTLKSLDGKTVSVADLKGSVVVLDFWATWCPPCREGLPHIDKVAKARAADGVKVFAVNLQEDPAQIQPFMQQAGLSLPVLLDTDGAVAQKYLAQSIPETVIIDKNGIVQNVVGLPMYPDEEKALNDLIDSALKAK